MTLEELETKVFTDPTFCTPSRIKELAKKWKKDGTFPGLCHGQLLDKAVKLCGFHSWNHFCAEIKE